jgi:hypothetical protein
MLNVVLHGLMGIVVGDKYIELLIPQIEDHVFIAGDWREERRLKQGKTYILSGVDGRGEAQKELAKGALTLRGFKQIDDGPAKLFCRIRLPFPDAVQHFRKLTAGETLKFKGVAAAKLENTEAFSLIPVLRYGFADANQLKLGDLRWFPQLSESGVVNLHIFSEPLTHEVTQHADAHTPHLEEGFANLVALFPGLDLQVSGHGMPIQSAGKDIGLPSVQQITLPERTADHGTETAAPQAFSEAHCPPIVMDDDGR